MRSQPKNNNSPNRDEPSREQLLLELQSLRQEVKDLKREKADLEILLETNTEHSDTVEAELLGQAESVLREGEEWFRAIAQANPIAVMITRLSDGIILYANPQAGPTLEIPTEELMGRQIQDFYYDIGDRQKILNTIAAQGSIHNYELRMKKANGTQFWIVVSFQPLTFNSQQTLMGAFYDITERKRAEESLQASERRLRRQSQALLELGRERTLNGGNLSAAIREIAEAATHTLEVERASVWLFMDAGESGGYPLRLSKAEASPTHIYCFDLYERSSDRHTSGMEIAATDYPIYFQELEAQRLLSASNARTDPRIEELRDSYLVPLNITSVLDVPIRLGGQMVGIICYEHTGPPRQWALEEENFGDSLANLVALAMEGFYRARAQEALSLAKEELEIKVEERTAELRQAVEQLRFEIEERQRAELALQQALDTAEAASRSKSTFLANMSHELRTPLNAIIGYSEILQEELCEQDLTDLVPDIEKIRGAGRHLLSLINDILDLSKIEAGRMKLYLETFDVACLVSEIVLTLRPLANKNGNILELLCQNDLALMHADLTKVRQVLFNLLSNALKFTSHGCVTLTVTRKTVGSCDWIFFVVTDTGIGMSAEQVEGLFQAFMQGDASTTRKYGGTGLGLAISKRFCEMMGGSIAVESQLGAGATFTVELPADVEECSVSTNEPQLSM